MKYVKLTCLIMITIFMFVPIPQKTIKAADHPFVVEWDVQGMRRYPKHRVQVIPFNTTFNPYRMRTFVFLLDTDGDYSLFERVVALYGIQEVRNAPYFSTFFEETKVKGTRGNYSFAIEPASGLEVETLNYRNTITSLPGYDPELHFLYDEIVDKLDISFAAELFTNTTYPESIDVDIDLFYLTRTTGVVGYWQILYEDGTLVNGNFTTYGLDNPIFWGPGDNVTDPRAYDAEYYWPDYNLTVAQDVERGSLPRTHSFKIEFPFVSIIVSFMVIVTILTYKKVSRRFKR